MPSQRMDISAAKSHSRSSSSANPKSAATSKWESELQGLSFALHRVNKTATVARSRAVAKIKNSKSWETATQETRDRMLQEAVEEVNKNRDIKREKAEQKWKELHDEKNGKERDTLVGHLIDVDSENERNTDENEVEEDTESEDSEQDDETISLSSEEAEEVDDSENDGEELTDERRQELYSRLLSLRAKQARENEEFLRKMEAEGLSRVGQEMPDDEEFSG